MRLIFLGSGAFAVPTLRGMADAGHEVALVVTQPAREAGRGRRVTRTPVAETARELGLPLVEVENVNTPEFLGRVASCGAELGLVIAFGQKLGKGLLASLPRGFINLHASLLPKYRGAAPINWAIIRGEERTGCTVFRLVERMDAGAMLTSRWTHIQPEETAGELHDRLAAIGVDAVKSALELFEDDQVPAGEAQDESQVSLAPKLSKADGVIDFNRPAVAVVHHVHGVTPWPGATTRFQAADGRWEQVSLVRVRRSELPEAPAGPPGTIDKRLMVAVKDGYLEILEIKPSSGRLMSWPEYVNGRRVSAGDRFGPER